MRLSTAAARGLQVAAVDLVAAVHERRHLLARRALGERHLDRRRRLAGLRRRGQLAQDGAVLASFCEHVVAGAQLAALAGDRGVDLEERCLSITPLRCSRSAIWPDVGALRDVDLDGARAVAVEGLEDAVDHVQRGDDDDERDHGEDPAAPVALARRGAPARPRRGGAPARGLRRGGAGASPGPAAARRPPRRRPCPPGRRRAPRRARAAARPRAGARPGGRWAPRPGLAGERGGLGRRVVVAGRGEWSGSA